MDDLIAFLNARLDEDETAANAAGDDDKARSWTSFDIGGYPVIGAGVDDGWGVTVVGPPAPSEAQVRHIARHDPARALREVAAKRAILDQLGTDLSYHPPVPPGHQRAWAIASLIAERMATVYSDHPDYRQEWKP